VPRVRVQTTVDAPPRAVWRRLADIADHVSWMADAASIRFTGDQRSGVGTTFECETRVGPLRTVDVMEVTEWRERRSMGVRHRGLVTGTGRFVLRRRGRHRTRLIWDETLRFPWWLGGAIGGLVGGPVLKLVWQGNLRRFAALVEPVEAGQAGARPGTDGRSTG
jgi:carbon monoxide dehydrogenase subunit G